MAAVGVIAPSEWRRYPDPATDLEVFRLTDPAFPSGMTAPHLRRFTRRGEENAALFGASGPARSRLICST